jgi:uncharacterized membrane protein
MVSSSPHILTSWIPLYSLIISGLILSISLLLKKQKVYSVAMLLIVFTSIMAFITGAFGGISMKAVKAAEGINHAALELHAWCSFGAVAFAIVLGILAFKRFRNTTEPDKITSIMMIVIGVLLFAFLITSMNFAAQIRIPIAQ